MSLKYKTIVINDDHASVEQNINESNFQEET